MIEEETVYQISAFITIFLLVLIYHFWNRKGKIKVRIKYPIREKEKWVKPEKDGKTLTIEKGAYKKAPWKVTFTNKSLVPQKSLFGTFYAVDVLPEATRAIEYDYELKKTDQPKWDKETSKSFIDAEILKQRGRALGYEMPRIFWIIVLLQIVVLVFQFLGMAGVRIGT